MPFEKGRKKTGGRVSGSQNKRDLIVSEKLKLLGFDPVTALMNFARGDWQALGYQSEKHANGELIIGSDLRAQCTQKLLDKVAPNLKAIEHMGEGGGPLETHVVYDTQWRTPADDNNEDAEAIQPDAGAASGSPEPTPV